jgi:magnesium-transporting ATPase (P-type)
MFYHLKFLKISNQKLVKIIQYNNFLFFLLICISDLFIIKLSTYMILNISICLLLYSFFIFFNIPALTKLRKLHRKNVNQKNNGFINWSHKC